MTVVLVYRNRDIIDVLLYLQMFVQRLIGFVLFHVSPGSGFSNVDVKIDRM